MMSLLAAVLAYLAGSISFAVILSRVMGVPDPRTYGSKNPGATNVLRSGNRAAAALTLFLDAAKGWLAVWAALTFGAHFGIEDDGVALVAVAVLLGHLYPIFFRFRGGKGVATAFGVLLALQWWLGLFVLASWLLVATFFRYSSLAALVAALFAPFFYLLLVGPDITAAAIVVISVLIIYRHRKNIGKLISGKETKIGQKGSR